MQSYEMVGGYRAGFYCKVGSKVVFLSPKRFFRRSLNVLNCFKSDSN